METIEALYLDLLKKALLDLLHSQWDAPARVTGGHKREATIYEARQEGLDWPERAMTMVGMNRLDNLQFCVERVLKDGIEGDFIETGVWRGGSCILMRAILKAYGVTDRTVWVADSFQGLPKPNPEKYPPDEGIDLSEIKELAISLEEVRSNFVKFALLDNQVQFLKGWFKDTLPNAPIEKLAVLRLDGDLYESTMDALTALYPKLSPSGYVIISNYSWVPACAQAVTDYRVQHGITEEIHVIDWAGVYWRKSARDVPMESLEIAVRETKTYYHERYEMTLREWLLLHQKEIVFTQSLWMGIAMWKNPMDAWIYQEIFFEVQPDYVIEIGSAHGGSTLFAAQMLDLVGNGSVISIDINRARFKPNHRRIIEIKGDCSSAEIVDQVHALCSGKKVCLIHDGDHSYEAVLRDLRLYCDLIAPGGYLIIEDSILDIFPSDEPYPLEPYFSGKGPLWAIEQFLAEHKEFEVDMTRERYYLTYNQKGFLKRVR